MKLYRISKLTGKSHMRDTAATEEQLTAWEDGVLIQDAFPDLSDDDREFIMTGITPEEWDAAFGEED
jgi:hypothetical protein